MKTKLEEFNTINKMLVLFDRALQDDELTATKIKQYQTKLDELAEKFQYDESLGGQRSKLYELQALIHFSQGHFPRGAAVLDEARTLMMPGENFVTETANEFVNRREVAQNQPEPVAERRFNGKLDGWLALYALRIVILPILLIYDLSSVHSIGSLDTTTDIGARLSAYLNAATIGDVLPLVATIFIWYIFFKKMSLAQKVIPWFEGYLVVYYGIFAIWLDSIIHDSGVTLDSDPVGKLGWGLIISALWLIYWLRSKRVKETFVNS